MTLKVEGQFIYQTHLLFQICFDLAQHDMELRLTVTF
jgi:hypothetical protein